MQVKCDSMRGAYCSYCLVGPDCPRAVAGCSYELHSRPGLVTMAELKLARAMGLTSEELSILHHELPVDVFSR